MEQAAQPTSTLKIIYQNIAGWENNKNTHRRYLAKYNSDVILSADTGAKNEDKIKFHLYICHQWNTEEEHSGVAILIRKKH